jgi:hypothetical protein
MNYVVHVGDRQDLPRISGDGCGRAPPVLPLRNVMARFLIGLFSLAADKRDLRFLGPVVEHYDHHLSRGSSDVPNVAASTEAELKQR